MAPEIHHPVSPADLDALLKSHPLVIVDFYADWCPPCRAIAPLFADLAQNTHASVADTLAFAKVNVDDSREIAALYRVSAMPTFLFFRNGKVEGSPLLGANVPVLKRLAGLFASAALEIQAGADPGREGEDEEAAVGVKDMVVEGGKDGVKDDRKDGGPVVGDKKAADRKDGGAVVVDKKAAVPAEA